ncbi:MAG: hypothetical protein U0T78_03335 [Cloacibacterium normanense]
MKTILLTAFLIGKYALWSAERRFRLIKQHFDRQENLLKIEFAKMYNNALAQRKRNRQKRFYRIYAQIRQYKILRILVH